jgi:hypothetical protein
MPRFSCRRRAQCSLRFDRLFSRFRLAWLEAVIVILAIFAVSCLGVATLFRAEEHQISTLITAP